ncbi:hypothetical protein Gocc_0504 [Gaiella occulta]|uniref:Uncharacterized protein n=1 Tax=Gaiella occulta TaxID=1002870 RepID=A0A7M2Z1Y8_9ACTN|nr:hypothetical protein [Gaiella occulta]RDI76085.1 hypothetical protein Gocc_0504 [Gaiella occulta]
MRLARAPASGDDPLAAYLRRRVDAGELPVGEIVEVEGAQYQVLGLDPVGADTRCVYVRELPGRGEIVVEIRSDGP